MKRKILLSESNLVSLVKFIIKETSEDMDIEKIVGTYKGNNPIIKDLQFNKIYKGINLTDEDIKIVKQSLQDEPKPTVDILKTEKPVDVNSLLQKKGTKTYLDIIKGEKNKLFNRILIDKHIKISQPDDRWFQDNIRDLEFLKKSFASSKGKMRWLDGSYETFSERINRLIERCRKKEYIGFIEENEDRKVWSILNKIDTNYSNWRKLIDDRLGKVNNGISGTNQVEVIENYFEQRSLDEVLPPERLTKFLELQEKLSTNIKTLSFAELDLLDAFGKKNSPTLQEIYNNISRTTNIGNETEADFLMLLRNCKEPNIEIVDFSTPGNVVDTAFGIDSAIKINGVWFAVQIKAGKFARNSAQKSFINNLGINSLSIFKKNNMFQFNYFSPTNKETEKSFNEDFGIK
jgi:hypothetical protein